MASQGVTRHDGAPLSSCGKASSGRLRDRIATSDTEEGTGSNPVRPTRRFSFLALSGSALRPSCEGGRIPAARRAGGASSSPPGPAHAQADLLVAHTEVFLEEEMERAEAALAQFMVRSDESCMRCHGPRRRITLAA
jgi:hypothetical protein